MSLAPSVVERLRGHRVLVIGDLMIDEYLRGEVHRVSPEAPVPVLDLRATDHVLGGAANTAHNLARLGATVTVAGAVGDDAGAGILADALRSAGITARLTVDPTRPTTRKTRVVAGGHQIVRIDAERRAPLDGPALADLLAVIGDAIADADAVVLSDYAKGVITGDVTARAIAACQRRAVPLVVDPKRRDFAIYRGATVLTPNLHELEAACGHPVADLAAIDRAAAALAAHLDDTALLVTRGADGMTLYQRGARGHHVPAAAREVFDVTGAGDTVVAALTLALAAALPLPDAMDLASVAAAIAVSRRGTATVEPDELAAALAARGTG